jgi:hypothetical protein
VMVGSGKSDPSHSRAPLEVVEDGLDAFIHQIGGESKQRSVDLDHLPESHAPTRPYLLLTLTARQEGTLIALSCIDS